ncbi:hypothetical protein SAMD00019534_021260 [Acytostelium subglobosum LB1]|uniref:hypothetical protein n=1 Tax=Acytostelium subglobosum LB1 TaxID=1410327 RepID=UPI0006449FAF|nr:hypothetical protein SAMD00019534_021260 [Acytostelium subglobosum LB1]GAM18951.1 hypothetical protein SAMD00019534_021260 [Acytostelium subglobosum LB1]|eukprot:XP_012758171.1 hypothetical protein SAMD00019534_021260 [Acytostelium subglobosum LB1]
MSNKQQQQQLQGWTAIGVTASTYEQAQQYIKELEFRQRDGLIDQHTRLIPITDPAVNEVNTQNNTKIGTGTSTLNALFVILEKLSVSSGKAYVDSDLIKSSKILLLNIGGLHNQMPLVNLSTKSFTILPLENAKLTYLTPSTIPDTAVCPIDILLSNLNRIVVNCGPGMVIASTESLLLLDDENPLLSDTTLWNSHGVTIATLSVPKSQATRHGVCRFDKVTGAVDNIGYQLTEEQLRDQGYLDSQDRAQVYTGMVRLCDKTTEKFLYLYSQAPMDSCTYLGVDNGAILVKFGWIPDVLLTMAKDQTWETYLAIEKPAHQNTKYITEKARKLLWKTFRGTPLRAAPLKGIYCYFRHSKDLLNFVNVQKDVPVSRFIHSFNDNKNPIKATVINSILHGDGHAEEGSIIYNCSLSGNWHIGKDTIVLGVRDFSYGTHFANRMAISEIRLRPQKSIRQSASVDADQRLKVLVTLGIDDDIDLVYTDTCATIANRPWSEFLQKTGISPEEIWEPNTHRLLRTARIFPVLTGEVGELLETALWIQTNEVPSLSIIGRWRSSRRLSIADICGESPLFRVNKSDDAIPHSKSFEGDVSFSFQWRRDLSFLIDTHIVEKIILAGEDKCIIPYFKKWAKTKDLSLSKILAALDRIALSAPTQYIGRMLSAISDFLAIYTAGEGGLRSGPARNCAWEQALQCFVRKDERKGITALAKERERWINSPENMIRAARHYEGAGQIFIKNIVDTCIVQLQTHKDGPSKIDQWCNVSMPARIDLSGGWSDTPPICYEHGGQVVNVAITVDQRRPIVVRARRVAKPHIVLHVESIDSDAVICTKFDDLSDYSRPQAPAALLKACFLQLGLVSQNSGETLETQIEKLGGGMEVVSASNLPQGSGLGTSSILAAGLLCAMARVYGRHYNDQHLVHAVLRVEQMLTTGGGWQDQVGGIVGGFKVARCDKRSDLISVEHRVLNINQQSIDRLNDHLLLIYTGRTRLARDLLQDVIRRWYAKTEEILNVTDALVSTTDKMAHALEKVDVSEVGKLLHTYWEQKKCMASGAEPTHVANLINLIKEYVHGYSLVGAGGGGFMVVITKEKNTVTRELIKAKLASDENFSSVTLHSAEIDIKGMEVSFE